MKNPFSHSPKTLPSLKSVTISLITALTVISVVVFSQPRNSSGSTTSLIDQETKTAPPVIDEDDRSHNPPIIVDGGSMSFQTLSEFQEVDDDGTPAYDYKYVERNP